MRGIGAMGGIGRTGYSAARRLAWLGLCGGSLWGCSGESDSQKVLGPDQDTAQAAFFSATRRVEVEIELAPADWDVLREQGRALTSFLELNEPYEYTYFDATVRVDGERYEHVQLRKKGFLGSLSALRPSLKLDLDRVVEGQNHVGLHSLTLNNDRQDPSHTHQCLAYGMFSDAGLPASRCNLAHVVVNGEDLGTYSNVESISKQFLKRHFKSAEGNLYEGQAADFDAVRVEQLQLKTNEMSNDRSDARALASALEAPDEQAVSTIGKQLDLGKFRDFWAMETLLGHWDSYSGNANNYFVYRDPASQRFVFLPWGVDAAFEGLNPFDPLNQNIAVYAAGRVANRLYHLPQEREKYRARLGELNESVWDVDRLLKQIDRIAALAPDADPKQLERQREHVRNHPGLLRAALQQPAPEWQENTTAFTSPCLGMLTDMSGSIDTSFGSLQEPLPGANQLSLNLDGKLVELSWVARAGLDESGDGVPRIRYMGMLEDQRLVVVEISMPPGRFSPGHHLFHGIETSGSVLVLGQNTFTLVGLIGDGAVDLEEAGTEMDAPVRGSFAGHVLQFSCAELEGTAGE
ncbi:MAG TPA: CotH kinase family protein [Polyangiaceae bacterium]|nr:CotH kinase family protein [Polyangiaceae bacterium]